MARRAQALLSLLIYLSAESADRDGAPVISYRRDHAAVGQVAAGRVAFWHAIRMAQFVTRLDDQLASSVDELVDQGVVASRSEAVRLALERLVDGHRRARIGVEIAEGYRRVPQSDKEIAGLEEATRALVEEEPW